MQIVFLRSTIADLRWFKQYYKSVFPEGRQNADRQYRAFLSLLKEKPIIGRQTDADPEVREYPIPRTPFTVLYRIKEDRLEVLRVYDQRSSFSNENANL